MASALVVSNPRPSTSNDDQYTLTDAVPVLGQKRAPNIHFQVPLIVNGGGPGAGTPHWVDFLSPVSYIQDLPNHWSSMRLLRASLVISPSVSITQNVGCSIVWGVIPLKPGVMPPATAQALLHTAAQAGQVNITNAGNTFVPQITIPIHLDQGGISSQLLPSGNIGNQFPPALRAFITTSGVVPGLGANELGVMVQLVGELEVTHPF